MHLGNRRVILGYIGIMETQMDTTMSGVGFGFGV